MAWVHKFDTHLWAPLHTSSGKLLWETAMPSSVTGVPTSFEVGGEQYIAVQAGWGVDAQRMQNGIDTLTGKAKAVPQGGAVMVFKLEK
jgi:alcohol dehydrogenase (cytochrome c)